LSSNEWAHYGECQIGKDARLTPVISQSVSPSLEIQQARRRRNMRMCQVSSGQPSTKPKDASFLERGASSRSLRPLHIKALRWSPQGKRRAKAPLRPLRSSLRAGSSCIPLSVVALQSGIDSLGRAFQLTSDIRGSHSGGQHFLELDFIHCCPASAGGSRSGHFSPRPTCAAASLITAGGIAMQVMIASASIAITKATHCGPVDIMMRSPQYLSAICGRWQ
jgi:hypothetical protein